MTGWVDGWVIGMSDKGSYTVSFCPPPKKNKKKFSKKWADRRQMMGKSDRWIDLGHVRMTMMDGLVYNWGETQKW